jgi:DNA-binding response OmpR family regulator
MKQDYLQGSRVLIIEDDNHVARAIEIAFRRAGATVHVAGDGRQGLGLFAQHNPDLVILDLMLPEVNGWKVCSEIVEQSEIPIIMVTALVDDKSLVQGLENGAVDFITKPFSVNVLLARSQAALRQAKLTGNRPATAKKSPRIYDDGFLAVNFQAQRVKVAGKAVHLTKTEYGILETLILRAGQVVTFEEILAGVWGDAYTDSLNYVHIYVYHLRQKVEEDPKSPVYLRSVRGMGYRFMGRPQG